MHTSARVIVSKKMHRVGENKGAGPIIALKGLTATGHATFCASRGGMPKKWTWEEDQELPDDLPDWAIPPTARYPYSAT